MKYVVLFVGTPYMDGNYMSVEAMYKALHSHRDRFPNLRGEWAQVSPDFVLSDDIFWVNHKKALEVANLLGAADGRTPRWLIS